MLMNMGLNFHGIPHLALRKVENKKSLNSQNEHSFDGKGSTHTKNRMCHEWKDNL